MAAAAMAEPVAIAELAAGAALALAPPMVTPFMVAPMVPIAVKTSVKAKHHILVRFKICLKIYLRCVSVKGRQRFTVWTTAPLASRLTCTRCACGAGRPTAIIAKTDSGPGLGERGDLPDAHALDLDVDGI